MTPDGFALAATIVLLCPMIYFAVASPTFLLVRFDDPSVTRVLRGLFKAYFLMMSVITVVGTIAYATTGRLVFAVGLGVMAMFAMGAGRWFLRRIDAEIGARDAGAADALPRLRRLHVVGMACNALQLVVVLASLPYAVVLPK